MYVLNVLKWWGRGLQVTKLEWDFWVYFITIVELNYVEFYFITIVEFNIVKKKVVAENIC